MFFQIILITAVLAVLLSVAVAQYGGYGLNFGFGQGGYRAGFEQGYDRRNGYGYNSFGNGYGGYPGGYGGYQQYGNYGR